MDIFRSATAFNANIGLWNTASVTHMWRCLCTGPKRWDHNGDPKSAERDYRPQRIILVRHGESKGNVDESAYVTTADWRIPLTEKGLNQAGSAGRQLRTLMGDEGTVKFYVSPYVRTLQTLDAIRSHIDETRIIGIREEPRICEQQFGNFQDVEEVLRAKKDRNEFGRFFYRFPSGESGLDVYNRVSSFISTVLRDCHQYHSKGHDLQKTDIVIVTHGLTLRLFLMRWFQFSVEEFEETRNPANARLVTLVKKSDPRSGRKWFELEDEARQALHIPTFRGNPSDVQLHPKGHHCPSDHH